LHHCVFSITGLRKRLTLLLELTPAAAESAHFVAAAATS